MVAKEARPEAEAEAARLEVERTSLLLEIRATKDEVFSTPKPAKTRRPWRIIRRPWRSFFPKATSVVFLNTTSVETNQRF